MADYLIKKKSGILEDYNSDKIINAITKSAGRSSGGKLTDQQEAEILSLVGREVYSSTTNVIPVENMHEIVIASLEKVRPDVAASYREYHDWRKKELAQLEEDDSECQSIQWGLEKSNANADSALVSTKRAKKEETREKSNYKRHFLTKSELQAINDGYIYIHDMGFRNDTMNCCLFNIKEVINGGFELGNIWYNDPKTLDTSYDVIGDIVLAAASQQYGGFTLPEIDEVLAPYAEKSYKMYFEEYKQIAEEIGEFDPVKADRHATKKVLREAEQGFQGWEIKFNTVASSRGDYPFITITLGHSTNKWAKELAKIALRVRAGGQGKKDHKKPVLFPKIVFLYDENLHGPGKELEDVYEEGLRCSSKTMYPDWLSLTGEGYIASIYKKYGKIISPMGCRAFLSPWYERGGLKPADENDEPIYVGRFNIGAISLNLPMILAKARREEKDFYEVLDHYLEMIRNIHLRTYDYLGRMKASMNPLAFCEGGFYRGHLGLNDYIEPCLEAATASFGITAFNELQRLYNGRSLYEEGKAFIERTGLTSSTLVKESFDDESFVEKGYKFTTDQYGFLLSSESGFFALDVLHYINKKVDQFKKEDGRLYAIYGTPAESLCGKQITQFRKEFGIVKNVSDREYVSNSFHCHVSEKINPIEKQDIEGLFWEMSNGGKIQYVRYPINYNLKAMRALIERAMKKGFYEGVNLSLAYCDDCGHEELEMDTCPKCGSKNLTKIDRMNGYLAFSRVHGDTRLNDAKMAEIKERVSM